ncbi:MAG: hypothetical protein EOP87_09905 [Verrucomicrobiaceae bacterium]|nr:MAG: hypothetical protein EOP87_09905 [Verrucomicrobiaceae bacterium]
MKDHAALGAPQCAELCNKQAELNSDPSTHEENFSRWKAAFRDQIHQRQHRRMFDQARAEIWDSGIEKTTFRSSLEMIGTPQHRSDIKPQPSQK